MIVDNSAFLDHKNSSRDLDWKLDVVVVGGFQFQGKRKGKANLWVSVFHIPLFTVTYRTDRITNITSIQTSNTLTLASLRSRLLFDLPFILVDSSLRRFDLDDPARYALSSGSAPISSAARNLLPGVYPRVHSPHHPSPLSIACQIRSASSACAPQLCLSISLVTLGSCRQAMHPSRLHYS